VSVIPVKRKSKASVRSLGACVRRRALSDPSSVVRFLILCVCAHQEALNLQGRALSFLRVCDRNSENSFFHPIAISTMTTRGKAIPIKDNGRIKN